MELDYFKNLIWEYTRKIAESSSDLFSPAGEKYGLTMLQVRILMCLTKCGSHTIGSLAAHTGIAGTNLSAMCKKLEGKGLIERVRNQEDERVVKVVLTKQGMEVVSDINKCLNDKISCHLACEPEETFRDIILGLQKLNALLQKMSKVE